MFRSIRRTKREISKEAAKSLLHHERRGVLAVNGEDGYPYALPLNFYYEEETNRIYFHGAKAGYKSEAIQQCDKVCFTVYGNEAIKKEAWAPYVQSVIVFGRCRKMEYGTESMEKLRKLAGKYFPEKSLIEEEIERSGKAVQMYEIEIEHLSGKEIQEK